MKTIFTNEDYDLWCQWENQQKTLRIVEEEKRKKDIKKEAKKIEKEFMDFINPTKND